MILREDDELTGWPAGGGASVFSQAERRILARIDKAFPDSLDQMGDVAEVEWHDPIAPRPLDQGDTTVECHLYDEDALAEAERRRAETPRVTAEL